MRTWKLWTKENDDQLILAIKKHFTATQQHIEGGRMRVGWKECKIEDRSVLSCRDHWVRVLDPHTYHGEWTKVEDKELLALAKRNKPMYAIDTYLLRPAGSSKRRYEELVCKPAHPNIDNQGLPVAARPTIDKECIIQLQIKDMEARILMLDEKDKVAKAGATLREKSKPQNSTPALRRQARTLAETIKPSIAANETPHSKIPPTRKAFFKSKYKISGKRGTCEEKSELSAAASADKICEEYKMGLRMNVISEGPEVDKRNSSVCKRYQTYKTPGKNSVRELYKCSDLLRGSASDIPGRKPIKNAVCSSFLS